MRYISPGAERFCKTNLNSHIAWREQHREDPEWQAYHGGGGRMREQIRVHPLYSRNSWDDGIRWAARRPIRCTRLCIQLLNVLAPLALISILHWISADGFKERCKLAYCCGWLLVLSMAGAVSAAILIICVNWKTPPIKSLYYNVLV